jgi:DNA-binding response OmpR family regulator
MLSNTVNKTKILVVEDNKSIIDGLEYLLQKEGFEAVVVHSKDQAISHIRNNEYDLFLLDVELPDGSGFEICKQLRNATEKPIIFITARAEESNIVYGLDIGADDYITKPFGNNELISRIKSVLRRSNSKSNYNTMLYKNIKVDLDKAKVYKNTEEVFLTNLEYKILLLLLNNVNKIVTREELLDKIWDIDGNFVNDNTLSVYIKRLRTKISEKDKPLIKTVRGIGYILNKISD